MTDLKLREMYQKWIQQVEECSETKSLLGESFSNPYYISTPKEWHQAKNKILIVGQEGHGEFGSGKTVGWHYKKDINRIQEYNQKYLHIQWNSIRDDLEYEYNKSCFWKVFRDIKEKANKSSTTVSCAWSNIDKIHRLGHGSNNCALLENNKFNQRKALHTIETKVLLEEIKILMPDIVVFLGTHYTSLEYALGNPSIRQVVENKWSINKHEFIVEEFNYKIENGETKTTKLIFRYFHPNAWKKHKDSNYEGSNYEEDFLKKIELKN